MQLLLRERLIDAQPAMHNLTLMLFERGKFDEAQWSALVAAGNMMFPALGLTVKVPFKMFVSLTAMRARMHFFSNTRTFVPGDSTTPVPLSAGTLWPGPSVRCPLHYYQSWGCEQRGEASPRTHGGWLIARSSSPGTEADRACPAPRAFANLASLSALKPKTPKPKPVLHNPTSTPHPHAPPAHLESFVYHIE